MLITKVKEKEKEKRKEKGIKIYQYSSINIYIYNIDLMQERMRFCHVAHSIKEIQLPLNHIRDKNKFKNGDSLFPLVQYFKANFC